MDTAFQSHCPRAALNYPIVVVSRVALKWKQINLTIWELPSQYETVSYFEGRYLRVASKMSNKKVWDKSEIIELINISEERAVLWNTKDTEYRSFMSIFSST